MTCTCGRVMLKNEVVGRNWSETCPQHGIGTPWYENGGKAYFDAYRAHSREMQALAREARETGKSQSHRVPAPPRREDFIKEDT